MNRRPIVGLGTPTLDRVIAVPEAPRFDSGMLVQTVGEFGGGPVATALVTARRLGWPAALLATVGSEPAGKAIIDGLTAEGVDTALVAAASGRRSATSTILVSPDADRAILYDPGDASESTIDDRQATVIRSAAGLLLERTTVASLAAARIARAAGVPVMLDAGGYDDRIMELVPLSTIVIASAYHAAARGLSPEDAGRELLAAGAEIAVVTLGEHGAIGVTTGARHEEAAYPVKAVDTTGAGDVYHGAFMVAYLEGQTLSQAMRFAALVAGLKCRQLGGRAGIPARDEVDAALG